MKPEDIMNAIGDVDERFVKQAHRKDLLKAVVVFLVVFLLLDVLSGFFLEKVYVLTRICPDFTANTGYIDPQAMEESWTSMEYTGINGTTVFNKTILGTHWIRHTEPDGEETVLHGYYNTEYLGTRFDDVQYTNGSYTNNVAGLIDHITVRAEEASPYGNVTLTRVELEYLTRSQISEQRKYIWGDSGNELVGYQKLYYNQYGLSLTKNYDPEGNMLCYTDYDRKETSYTAVSYDASGNVTGYSSAQFDWLGRIKSRQTMDAQGELIGTEIYNYRSWEKYYSVAGLLFLSAMLSLSLLAAFSVYDDRIVLPVKKGTEVPATKPKPTPKPATRSAEEKKREQTAYRHAKTMVIVGILVFLVTWAVTFYIDGVVMCPYPAEAWENQQKLVQAIPGYENARIADVLEHGGELRLTIPVEQDGRLHLLLFGKHPGTGRRTLMDIAVVALDYSGEVRLGNMISYATFYLEDGLITSITERAGSSMYAFGTYSIVGVVSVLAVLLIYQGIYSLHKRRKRN